MHTISFQIYYFVSCISISLYLYEERDFLTGKAEKPSSKSFLGASSCELRVCSTRVEEIFLQKLLIIPIFHNSKRAVQHAVSRLCDSRNPFIDSGIHRVEKGSTRIPRPMDCCHDARHLCRNRSLYFRRDLWQFKVWATDWNIIYNRLLHLVSQCKH